MRVSLSKLFLAAFALTALASIANVACSAPTSVDHGTDELVGSPYGGHYGHYGYGGGYGYQHATNLVPDTSTF